MKLTEQKLIVKQKVEMLEVFINFETKNRYSVNTESGEKLFYAYEESNWFLRQITGSHRKLKVHILDNTGKEEMTIERPFYFFIADHTIYSPDGSVLGRIKKRFTWVNHLFEIYDQNDTLIFKIKSRIPKIWTFNIFQHDHQVGQILKKWSGIGKEMFTDADNFLVDFNRISDNDQRKLILAAAFAIDLSIFERKK